MGRRTATAACRPPGPRRTASLGVVTAATSPDAREWHGLAFLRIRHGRHGDLRDAPVATAGARRAIPFATESLVCRARTHTDAEIEQAEFTGFHARRAVLRSPRRSASRRPRLAPGVERAASVRDGSRPSRNVSATTGCSRRRRVRPEVPRRCDASVPLGVVTRNDVHPRSRKGAAKLFDTSDVVGSRRRRRQRVAVPPARPRRRGGNIASRRPGARRCGLRRRKPNWRGSSDVAPARVRRSSRCRSRRRTACGDRGARRDPRQYRTPRCIETSPRPTAGCAARAAQDPVAAGLCVAGELGARSSWGRASRSGREASGPYSGCSSARSSTSALRAASAASADADGRRRIDALRRARGHRRRSVANVCTKRRDAVSARSRWVVGDAGLREIRSARRGTVRAPSGGGDHRSRVRRSCASSPCARRCRAT